MEKIAIFWFRRDLRLEDNAGLYQALTSPYKVLPIFIFDRNILDELEDKQDRRVQFIYHTIKEIAEKLQKEGKLFKIFYGNPLDIFVQIIAQYPIAEVYTNRDYESYALQRDKAIQDLLWASGIELKTFKDQCILEKSEVLSGEGKPYTVFTPYSRKWKATLTAEHLQTYPTGKYFSNFIAREHPIFKNEDLKMIALQEMGFQETEFHFPDKTFKENIIKNYGEKRDFPAIEGTSRLSVHLRFGTISIRALAQKAKGLSEHFLNELIWRDFYMMITFNFPHINEGKAFRQEYDKIEWRNNPKEFEAWCAGKTGYPIVDAGMRELNATGFMHNRVRMITASFLIKHLLIDWRWGEAYFAKKLLDFDFSANNGGWQWAASSGCDAAPYFRIFNPTTQAQKFDNQLKYIKHWIPELSSFDYPKPIVEHTFARNRVLEAYKKALGKLETTN